MPNGWTFLKRVETLIWLLVAASSIFLFVRSMEVRYELFQHSCSNQTACENAKLLTPQEASSLLETGFTMKGYSTYLVGLDLIHGMASFGIAALIYWKSKRSLFTWFASISVMATGTVTTIGSLSEAYPSITWIAIVMTFLSSGYLVFFYLFPNGRFIPRWTVYPVSLWVLFSVGRTFLKGSFLDPFTWPPIWNFGGWIAFHLVALISQIIRYRAYSGPTERQQTKWFLYGLSAMIAGLILESVLENTRHFLEPGFTDTVLRLAVATAAALGSTMVPVSIGIAMQRYRLWDIDYVIRIGRGISVVYTEWRRNPYSCSSSVSGEGGVSG